MAYIPSSGSVVAFQGNPSVLQAVVLVTNPVSTLSVNPTPSSVLVLNPVSLLGVTQSGAWSASLVGTIPGSVVAFQGTSEWTVKSSIAGGVFPVSGSVAAVVTNNVTVVSSLAGGIFPVSGSVAAVITNTNVNVSGSVVGFQGGTQITSLVSTVPSSVIVGASIFGQLPAGTAPIGSVAVLQGTNPWIQTFSNSSILAVPVGSIITTNVGSVIAVLQTPSIVGTYAEDATHTTADRGLFVLGVRNDAIASFTSANLEYGPQATDSAGRAIIKPFSSEDGIIISYVGSVVSGSVTLISASAIGMRNYITDFWVANTGSVSTLITFQDGSTSILGRTIAPAGGGSNSQGIAIPLKTAPSQDLAFTMGTMASVLYMTVKGYRAP